MIATTGRKTLLFRTIMRIPVTAIVLCVMLSPAVAQFQKTIRPRRPDEANPPVYCPRIDLNGEPQTQTHPLQPQPQIVLPPPIPPATDPPRLVEDKTPEEPSELERLGQAKRRRMEEILRRLQSYRNNTEAGRVPPTPDNITPPRPDLEDPQNATTETGNDDVPVPPDFATQATEPTTKDVTGNAAEESATAESNPASPPPVENPETETTETPSTDAAKSRKKLSDLLDALTADEATEPQAEEPETTNGPGYLSATTVLNSPVDRIKLADNLFATGETQLALTMYEAVETSDLPSDDRNWLAYQMACCHRRLGLIGEAESAYRQLAGDSDAGNISVVSRWWLEQLEDRKELEAQADQIKTLLKTYKEAQANDDTTTK